MNPGEFVDAMERAAQAAGFKDGRDERDALIEAIRELRGGAPPVKESVVEPLEATTREQVVNAAWKEYDAECDRAQAIFKEALKAAWRHYSEAVEAWAKTAPAVATEWPTADWEQELIVVPVVNGYGVVEDTPTEETYIVKGHCENCRKDLLGRFPKGSKVGEHYNGPRCAYCDCRSCVWSGLAEP